MNPARRNLLLSAPLLLAGCPVGGGGPKVVPEARIVELHGQSAARSAVRAHSAR